MALGLGVPDFDPGSGTAGGLLPQYFALFRLTSLTYLRWLQHAVSCYFVLQPNIKITPLIALCLMLYQYNGTGVAYFRVVLGLGDRLVNGIHRRANGHKPLGM